MTMVQMNVRIDGDVKERVDEVLERKGVTPSAVVREVWDYIDDHGDTPELETALQQKKRKEEALRKRKAADDMAGLVPRLLEENGLIGHDENPYQNVSYRELRDYADEQKYLEYMNQRGEGSDDQDTAYGF